MHKLGFLIAGVQKGGTTALWHFLKQHPQIRFGPRKEMHFFDDESLDWINPDYELLHKHYTDAPSECLLGDATPIYTYWPPSMARIHAYNKDIKIIVSLRDPVERAWSHWRMETNRGLETLSFSEAIRSGRDRIEHFAGDEKCHRVYSYVDRGYYARQLDRLLDFFPTKQLLIIEANEMRSYQRQTLDAVTDFLNLERFESYPENEIVFASGDKSGLEIGDHDSRYLCSIYEKEKLELNMRYGVDFYRNCMFT